MYSTRAAVAIGINYNRTPETPPTTGKHVLTPDVAPLRYAEADAAEIASVLRSSGYEVVELLGAAATRRNIIEALRQQSLRAGSEGLLLAYFAGHGEMDPYVGTTAYLVPFDADLNALDATAIPLDELARHMGSAGAAMTLLDCCHSGYALGKGGQGRSRQARVGAEFARQAQEVFGNLSERIVLAACGGSQQARELDRLGHGAFTYFVLDHWRNNPEVDDMSLSRHVSTALAREGLPLPVRGGVQQGLLALRGPQGAAGQSLKYTGPPTQPEDLQAGSVTPAPSRYADGAQALLDPISAQPAAAEGPQYPPRVAGKTNASELAVGATSGLAGQGRATPRGPGINRRALGIGVLLAGLVVFLCFTVSFLLGVNSESYAGNAVSAWYGFCLTALIVLTPFALVGGGLVFLSKKK